MDSKEFALLRTEVETAWQEVQATAKAYQDTATPKARADAAAALAHWRKLFDLLRGQKAPGFR